MNFSRILALSPHTDDVEFGAGGTLARLLEKNSTIFSIALSTGDADAKEFRASMRSYGLAERSLLYSLPTRGFPAYRQWILDFLVRARKDFKPDLVLVPSSRDVHQDHQTVTNEAIRAFRQCTILGYTNPRNHVHLPFRSLCFVKLERRHVEAKIAALSQYRSQAHRHVMSPGVVWAAVVISGACVDVEYAETFEVIRWVL